MKVLDVIHREAAPRGSAGRALCPAVFLDKDGTLVQDVPFNVDPARVVFTPGALPALRALQAAGYALVVVSNQSGLALGRFTPAAFEALRCSIVQRLRQEALVHLDGFYFCPHAPDAGCACRKPAPGMLQQAAGELRLDLARSWMVGDILDDVEAGARAGCRGGVLLDVGHETLWRFNARRRPAHRVKDLWQAAQRILVADGCAASCSPLPQAGEGGERPLSPDSSPASGRGSVPSGVPA